MIGRLIQRIIRSVVLCSVIVLFLSSCCKFHGGKGTLQPEWETRIPTGSSKVIFYDGLPVLPKYKDWIIAHTTVYDGGFNLEDNRLCAVNLKTGLVDWYFPKNIEERHYCDFDAKSYLYKNKLVFQYQKDARTYESRDLHTTCCLNLDKNEVIWEIERQSDKSVLVNMDIIGKEERCYFVQDNNIVCCVNLNTDVRTDIYKDDSLKINHLSFADKDRLLLFCYIEVIGSSAYRTYIKILNLRTKEIEYFRKLTPENANTNITSIPAIGFEKEGILYAALDTYTAAIDVKKDKLLWGRQDIWSYNAKDMFEYRGVLLKCGVNATTGYNAKTGEVLYNYDNYGSYDTTQQGQYAYLVNRKQNIDIINIETGQIVDYVKCKYADKGEDFSGSYPTLIDGKMYIMSYNHLFRYPTYPW